jgi:Delta3-Delta2-enoyl-CoA isomerase
MMTTDILSVSYALNDALAIVSLHREPVNSMNTAVWTALLTTLDELEANPKVRGIVFKSTLKRNVFTAGNDLSELYAPRTTLAQYSNFWVISNIFLARLYTSPLFTVAAVKGACPAGGCCLAMCCDFRIVTEDASLGLNEVAIGITVPAYWIKVMIGIIGQGKTDKLTQYARSVGAEEALKIGLVDTVVPSDDALEPAALKLAKEIFKLPDAGRSITKDSLRGELGRSWGDKIGLENEAHQIWGFLTQEHTVRELKAVMSRLSKSKEKSKL